MRRKAKLFLIAGILIGSFLVAIFLRPPKFFESYNQTLLSSNSAASLVPDIYPQNGVVSESDSLMNSRDPYWWLDSGGQLMVSNGLARTFQGDLSEFSYWRRIYSVTSPRDTDNGVHPQNIFRLMTKTRWSDFYQSAYFKINKYNLSASPNRNESNGLFFFSRFQDSNNLYYAGLRVDGSVVVKKKYKGTYYTLAILPFFIDSIYDRNKNPSLIPKDTWIGLKMETKNLPNGGVHLGLCLDVEWTGNWSCPLNVVDSGKTVPVLDRDGLAGIRTDFMDVEFVEYEVN